MQIIPFPEAALQSRCIFFDAYGVLNGAGGAFPWVVPTFDALRVRGIPFYVVTNDSSNLVDGIAAKLSPQDGPPIVTARQVISSGLICQNYIERHLAGSRLVYFGEEKSTGYLAAANEIIHIRDIKLAEDADGFVMLGCGDIDWRVALDLSVNYIRYHPDMALLAPNPDILFYAGEQQVGLAAGSLAGLLEKAVNRRFLYFGKPHKVIFEFAFDRARADIGEELRASDVLMVGDNMFTDIPGAKEMGFQTCLVLSGNTSGGSIADECAKSGCTPDYVCESIVW